MGSTVINKEDAMNLSTPAVAATIRRIRTLTRLDAYGLALANVGHYWTVRERREFERRVRELKKV